MIKKKTSVVQKKLATHTPSRILKPGAKAKLSKFSSSDYLLDESFVGKAMLECLLDNDAEGVIDLLNAHYRARSRLTASNSGLASSTFYHLLKSKNPTLKTLARLMSSLK
jgi:DNA-binding phage protein